MLWWHHDSSPGAAWPNTRCRLHNEDKARRAALQEQAHRQAVLLAQLRAARADHAARRQLQLERHQQAEADKVHQR